MRVYLFAFSLLLNACGTDHTNKRTDDPRRTPSGDPWVVMTRSTLSVNIVGHLGLTTWSSTGTSQSQVVNASINPSATMSLSTDNFSVPTLTSDADISFGHLDVSALKDNHLNVCGTNGNQKCTAAALRVYTSGTAGDGFWNSVDGYGAPLYANVDAVSPAVVGLGSTSAAYVSQISIDSSTHVVSLSSFSTPNINITGDFSNAGAGTYVTTINLEFVVGN